MPQSSSHFSSSTPTLQISPMPVSSPLASIPAFDKVGLDPAQVSLNRLQQIIGVLDSTLRLPSTPRAFAVYLMGLAIVAVGAFMHVYLAAQIMQAEFTLSQLRQEYRALEQQNGDIIFKIARDTNLQRLHERVRAMGYGPLAEREYIFVPSESIAEVAPAVENQPGLLAEDVQSATASDDVAIQTPATVSPASTFTRNLGGQVSNWQEFWSNTLSAAAGKFTMPQIAAPQSAQLTNAPTGNGGVQTVDNTNFWAAWWEEASEQGVKLLDQLRGE